MFQHILLAVLTGLLSCKYEDDEKFLSNLWLVSSVLWTIMAIVDVIKLFL